MHGIHTRTHTQALAHTERHTHIQPHVHTHTQCELGGIYTSAHTDLLHLLLLLFRLVDSV